MDIDLISTNLNFDLEGLIQNANKLNWDCVSENKNIKWSNEIIEKFQNYFNWEKLVCNDSINWKDSSTLVLADKYGKLYDVLRITEGKWNSKEFFDLKKEKKLRENWRVIQRDFLSFDMYWDIEEFIQEFDSFRQETGPIINTNYNSFTGEVKESVCYYSETFFELFTDKLEEVFEAYWKKSFLSFNEPFLAIDDFDKICMENGLNNFYTKKKWESLSKSKSIPWSFEIIEKYKNKWHWQLLLRNDSIDWTVEMIEKWNSEIENFEWENDFDEDITPNAWNGLIINSNLKVPLEYIAKTIKPNWKFLVQNTGIIFSFEYLKYIENELIPIIEKNCECEIFYFKKLIFGNLHKNKSIKWTYEILYEYKEFLNWNELVSTGKYLDFQSLSFIEDLLYTEKFIDDFKDVINFDKLSSSINVEWSTDLIIKYKDLWSQFRLKNNKAIQWDGELNILFPEKMSDKRDNIWGMR